MTQTVQIKARNNTKRAKPMDAYLNGKDLYNKCVIEAGWDKDMAMFNAYKHSYTNYVNLVRNEIFQADLSYKESVDRMKSVYQQLMLLVPERYKEQCKKSFVYSIRELNEYVQNC